METTNLLDSFSELLKGGAYEEDEKYPIKVHGRHGVGVYRRGEGSYLAKIQLDPTSNGLAWPPHCLFREAVWGIRIKGTEFSIPEVVEHYTWDSHPYLLRRYISGTPLLTKFGSDTARINANLDLVVKIAINLLKIPLADLYQIPEDNTDHAKAFINKTRGWFDTLQHNNDFRDLMNTVEGISPFYIPWVNHGDFTPWHLLLSDKQLYLIDAEHAGTTKPKWYDVVYFAHRLATQCNGFEEMQQFFRRFHDALESENDQHDFCVALYPLMASRIIGGIWDAQNDKSDMDPHHQIVKVWRNKQL